MPVKTAQLTPREQALTLTKRKARARGCFVVEKPEGYLLYRSMPNAAKGTLIGKRASLGALNSLIDKAGGALLCGANT